MTTTPTMLATRIATLVEARLVCLQRASDQIERGNVDTNASEGAGKHAQAILSLVEDHLPSGSGFTAPMLDFERSTGEKLVLMVSFHHMTDHGMYDGYTHHRITVTASLTGGFNLKIAGRDRNGIKDYIHECFGVALAQVG